MSIISLSVKAYTIIDANSMEPRMEKFLIGGYTYEPLNKLTRSIVPQKARKTIPMKMIIRICLLSFCLRKKYRADAGISSNEVMR
jgi:hypothetical protein